MTDKVVVNRDRTRLLPPNSPEKGWHITLKEAKALGLVESEEKPKQSRRATPQKRRKRSE